MKYKTIVTSFSPNTYRRCSWCKQWYLTDDTLTDVPPADYGTDGYYETNTICKECYAVEKSKILHA